MLCKSELMVPRMCPLGILWRSCWSRESIRQVAQSTENSIVSLHPRAVFEQDILYSHWNRLWSYMFRTMTSGKWSCPSLIRLTGQSSQEEEPVVDW
jgi:hypothetical protein